MGVALWLVPSNGDVLKLKTIMHPQWTEDEHTQTSTSSYPDIKPHITIVSLPSAETSLLALREAIPVLQSPISVQFKSIEIGDTFFRSVYIAIHLTPDLASLNKHIHAKLWIESRTPHFPHLSLCYIDDKDAQNGERERFVKVLERDGRLRKHKDGVDLDVREGTEAASWLSGFEASEIWIADCDGPVREWKVLEKLSIITGNCVESSS